MIYMFVEISEKEFDGFMLPLGYNPISLAFTNEKVYERELGNNIVIRVFSTLEDGYTREVGRDAIRVCLVDKEKDRGLGKAKKTLRTGNNPKDVFNRLKGKLDIMELEGKRFVPQDGKAESVQKGGVNEVEMDISSLDQTVPKNSKEAIELISKYPDGELIPTHVVEFLGLNYKFGSRDSYRKV